MEKTYECLKETLEEQVKLISKKGDKITPDELMSLKNALSSLIKINELMQMDDGYKEGYSYGYHGTSRSPVTGRYISNGTSPHGTMRMAYGDHYDHMYGHSIKDRMVARLEPMYDEAKTEHERQMISNAINQIQSNN